MSKYPSKNSHTRQNTKPHATDNFYVADPLLAKAEFAEHLQELTFNCKEIINKLTYFSGSNVHIKNDIVEMIRRRLQEVRPDLKLPVIYTIDSIIKNLGEPYKSKFQDSLISDFLCIFDKSDDKTKTRLYKLRLTWDPYYSLIKLHELDNTMQTTRDRNWPIKPLPRHLADSINKSHKKVKSEVIPVSRSSEREDYDLVKPHPGSLSNMQSQSSAIQRDLQQQKELILKEMELQKAKRELQKIKDEHRKMKIKQKNKELEQSNVSINISGNAQGSVSIDWGKKRREENKGVASGVPNPNVKLETETNANSKGIILDPKATPMPKIVKFQPPSEDKIKQKKKQILQKTLEATYGSADKNYNKDYEIVNGHLVKDGLKIDPKTGKPLPIPKANLAKIDTDQKKQQEQLLKEQEKKGPRNIKNFHTEEKGAGNKLKSSLKLKENKAKSLEHSKINTFTFPGEQPVSKSKIEIPESIMKADKDTLYLHARKQYKGGVLNKEQYEKLLAQLKILIEARDRQLAQIDRAKLDRKYNEMKNKQLNKNGNYNSDADFYMAHENKSKIKTEAPTNPMDMLTGSIDSEEETSETENIVLPGQENSHEHKVKSRPMERNSKYKITNIDSKGRRKVKEQKPGFDPTSSIAVGAQEQLPDTRQPKTEYVEPMQEVYPPEPPAQAPPVDSVNQNYENLFANLMKVGILGNNQNLLPNYMQAPQAPNIVQQNPGHYTNTNHNPNLHRVPDYPPNFPMMPPQMPQQMPPQMPPTPMFGHPMNSSGMNVKSDNVNQRPFQPPVVQGPANAVKIPQNDFFQPLYQEIDKPGRSNSPFEGKKEENLMRLLTDPDMPIFDLMTNDDLIKPIKEMPKHQISQIQDIWKYLKSGVLCTKTLLRFPRDHNERHKAHLDWVYQDNRKTRSTYRGFYMEQGDWITYSEYKINEKKDKKPVVTNKPNDDEDLPCTPEEIKEIEANRKRKNSEEIVHVGTSYSANVGNWKLISPKILSKVEKQETEISEGVGKLAALGENLLGGGSKRNRGKNRKGQSGNGHGQGDIDDREDFLSKQISGSSISTDNPSHSPIPKKKMKFNYNKNGQNITPVTKLTTEDLKRCHISGEPFETYYDNDTEIWYAKDCIIQDGKAYNVKNLKDYDIIVEHENNGENLENNFTLNENLVKTRDSKKQINSNDINQRIKNSKKIGKMNKEKATKTTLKVLAANSHSQNLRRQQQQQQALRKKSKNTSVVVLSDDDEDIENNEPACGTAEDPLNYDMDEGPKTPNTSPPMTNLDMEDSIQDEVLEAGNQASIDSIMQEEFGNQQ